MLIEEIVGWTFVLNGLECNPVATESIPTFLPLWMTAFARGCLVTSDLARCRGRGLFAPVTGAACHGVGGGGAVGSLLYRIFCSVLTCLFNAFIDFWYSFSFSSDTIFWKLLSTVAFAETGGLDFYEDTQYQKKAKFKLLLDFFPLFHTKTRLSQVSSFVNQKRHTSVVSSLLCNTRTCLRNSRSCWAFTSESSRSFSNSALLDVDSEGGWEETTRRFNFNVATSVLSELMTSSNCTSLSWDAPCVHKNNSNVKKQSVSCKNMYIPITTYVEIA